MRLETVQRQQDKNGEDKIQRSIAGEQCAFLKGYAEFDRAVKFSIGDVTVEMSIRHLFISV